MLAPGDKITFPTHRTKSSNSADVSARRAQSIVHRGSIISRLISRIYCNAKEKCAQSTRRILGRNNPFVLVISNAVKIYQRHFHRTMPVVLSSSSREARCIQFFSVLCQMQREHAADRRRYHSIFNYKLKKTDVYFLPWRVTWTKPLRSVSNPYGADNSNA